MLGLKLNRNNVERHTSHIVLVKEAPGVYIYCYGQYYTFQDTHAKENGAPIVDSASQDWKLLESSEDGDVTRVTVQRYLRLCDSDNRNITVQGDR